MDTAERERVAGVGQPEEGLFGASPWYEWGPYLAERAWGTVREDYSEHGTAWDSFPHDHARSRAYRWNEDGLAGLSDIHHRLCLALALWNGEDPILKERFFGLTGTEGNHGEDVKEYWWFTDAVPSHAWLAWRYHYPQRRFPYDELLAENRRRGRDDPEYELLDTGAFDDDRYWIVDVEYAKTRPTEILARIRVRNVGPEAATLHVLPTLWFRNTWSWDVGAPRPEIRVDDGALVARHPDLGPYRLEAAPGPDGTPPTPLVCENETNHARLHGTPNPTPFPKDGINDHVVAGAPTVNPAGTGTKGALHHVLEVPAGGEAVLRLRLRHDDGDDTLGVPWSSAAFDEIHALRRAEADAFYADLTPADATEEEARVMRQAFAGMIWSKQAYIYDVARWLDGDPAQPPPPPARHGGRNARWRHLDAFDILSMPDTWEYPWFAAWDLAFHTVALAHLDPAFAKYQLVTLCREWFQHPKGGLPAYEWAFDDLNPPVHAWAALRVWEIDGRRDRAFLERVFQKLLINWTWWLNREDWEGNNLFEGGFLGLDNVGPFDRSNMPVAGVLEQSDATAWMAGYCIAMLRIADVLADEDPVYEDICTTFLEHFVAIAGAMTQQGLWDEDEGFFFDVLVCPDGRRVPIKVRSIVGVIPALAAITIDFDDVEARLVLRKGFARFMRSRDLTSARLEELGHVRHDASGAHALLSIVRPDQLRRLLAEVLDEGSLLSPHGVRSLSRRHAERPFEIEIDGVRATVAYEPAESRSGLFGGNSNWRGPVWFPLNYLLVEALERYHRYLGDGFTVECPTGSGVEMTLQGVADDLRRRLVSLFLTGPDGRRPVHGWVDRLQRDPEWRSQTCFFEYFHGDNGAGLGASHQTGWTGLVADLISARRGR